MVRLKEISNYKFEMTNKNVFLISVILISKHRL